MARKSRKQVISLEPLVQPDNPSITYNTALYMRLSVMDAGRDDSESISNQHELLERYVTDHSDLSLQATFVDNGKTGTNFDRPAWQDLLHACKTGTINCIVIKDLSRLGRNYIETGEYLERIFPMMGIRIIAVNDRYDSLTLSQGERLVSGLKNLVNDIYAKDISRKVLTAMHTSQKNGDFLGAYASYGYTKDPSNPKKIIINPETAPIVKRIFELKAEGLGNGAICKVLNSEDIPCPNKYRYLKGLSKQDKHEHCLWIISTVANILRNPMYLGHMAQGKQRAALCEGQEKKNVKREDWIIVKHTHEPIVTQSLFDEATLVFDKRSSAYQAHRHKNKNDEQKRSDLLLYDTVFCADCGRALARRKLSKKKNQPPTWAFKCKQYLDLGACSPKFILEQDLYVAVYHAIRSQVQSYVEVSSILDKLNQDSSYQSRLMRCEQKIASTSKEIRRLDSLRESAYEDYASQLLTTSEYQFASDKYQADIEQQKNKLTLLQDERNTYTTATAQTNHWIATFEKFMTEPELSRAMVQAFIHRVEVSKIDQLTITFKFRDELEALSNQLATAGGV